MGVALLVAERAKERQEAKPTRKRHEPEFVTHEELKEAIEEATKEMQFEWNEWYEKFDKLHLRLAKRAKRAEAAPDAAQDELGIETAPRPSVLQYRRLGSI